jgi:hypothetical protein
MTDRTAKRVLGISIVAGGGLGLLWGSSIYGLLDLRTLNVAGFVLIMVVSLSAAVIAIGAHRRDRRRRRERTQPTTPA